MTVVAWLVSHDMAIVLIVATMGLIVVGQLWATYQLRLADRRFNKRLDHIDEGLTRHHQQLTNVERLASRQAHELSKLQAEVHNNYRELEALLNLYAMIPVLGRVQPMRGWAASPDLLLLLVEFLRKGRPNLTVECGSGVSTLWCALALRHFGVEARVVALEHDPTFAAGTQSQIDAHGVTKFAEVRLAPLVPVEIGNETYKWYDRRAWSDLDKIDLLFVDGPPGTTGPLARLPALPLLGDRLTAEAIVVLDDMNRADEQAVVRRWLEAAPGLVEERINLEKDVTVLRLDPRKGGTWLG